MDRLRPPHPGFRADAAHPVREARNEAEVLAHMPLITIEKVGDSDPVPFTPNATDPLSGVPCGIRKPRISPAG